MSRFRGLFVPLLLCTACVVGAPRPTPRVETTRAPVAPVDHDVALPATAGCTEGDARERPPRPSSDAVWVDGYCHHTGVRYTWVQGSWRER